MNDIVVGDEIEWSEAVWDTFYSSWRRGRSGNTPNGQRSIRATVVRESYGPRTGQHTFSLRVVASSGYRAPGAGETILRKGRNLYGNLVDQVRADDPDRQGRAEEKHRRGEGARQKRCEERGGTR